jgi:hypothetical protein
MIQSLATTATCWYCSRLLPIATDLTQRTLGDDEVAWIADPVAVDVDNVPEADALGWLCGRDVVIRADDV